MYTAILAIVLGIAIGCTLTLAKIDRNVFIAITLSIGMLSVLSLIIS